MNNYRNFLVLFLIISLLMIGCSSSEETSQEKEATTASQQNQTPKESTTTPPETTPPSEQVSKENQGEQSKTTEQLSWENKTSSGKFAVQVGAYQQAEKAEQLASSARERFQMNVLAFKDKESGYTKILVGNFLSKDEARTFRDKIAKQYPEEYKDAWVTEIPLE